MAASFSSVQSRCEVLGEKRIPSGSSTAWLAMFLAASKYFVSSGGDITSELPTFMKPSPEAESVGNSFAGSSEATPVKSRIV